MSVEGGSSACQGSVNAGGFRVEGLVILAYSFGHAVRFSIGVSAIMV